MKHLAAIALFLALGTAGIAHAEGLQNVSTGPPPIMTNDDTGGVGSNSSLVDTSSGGSSIDATPSGENTNTASPDAGTGAGQGGSAQQAFGPILAFFMSIFAWLAGTAGVILNDTVYYTVVQMGSVVNPNNLSAIGVAWKVLRDIGNIVLIFGFIAIGITTILDVNWYGGSKRIITLLIVAIFINFSLFATEAVVDVGNLFATQFYTQMNGGEAPGVQGFSADTIANGGISGTIMDSLALQTFYNINNGQDNSSLLSGVSALFDMKIALIAVLAILLFIVLAFVLFSLSIILIVRFVTLVLLMIVAPVGFAGLVVPGLEGQARKWWHKLFEQTVTAPALLLVLYIALAIITDAKFLTGFGAQSGSYMAAAGGSTDPGALTAYAGLLLAFLVAMAFLLACVVLAKQMGAAGAGAATKWAGKASFGLAAYGMSGVVGGSAFVTRRTLQRVAPNNKVVQATSKYILNPLEKAKIDVRRLPGAKTALEAAGAKEAATPIAKSPVTQIKDVVKSFKEEGKNAQKEYDQQTRIPRLKDAIAKNDGATANKIMRSLTDEELASGGIQDLIRSNPLAVRALTNAQAAKLSDKTIINPSVYLNMSVAQLESIRGAGNMAQANAHSIGLNLWHTHPRFQAYFGLQNAGKQQDMKDFWNLP